MDRQRDDGPIPPGLLDSERVKGFAVIMPFCEADYAGAMGLLSRHIQLKAPPIDRLVLMPDNDVDIGHRVLVSAVAKKAAKTITVTPQDISRAPRRWPYGTNLAFLNACAQAAKLGCASWLFLEPDAVPVTPDWLQRIMADYAKSTMLFMGACTVCQPPLPILCMNGVGVYPGTVPQDFLDSFKKDLSKPFDVALSAHYKDKIQPTKRIQFALLKDRKPVEWKSQSQVRPHTVLVHGDKSGKLVKLLSERKQDSKPKVEKPIIEREVSNEPMIHVPYYRKTVEWEMPKDIRKVFWHSGDLGDIIYALPLIRWLGGGALVIGPCTKIAPFFTRETMTIRRFNLIRPLLAKQPYLTSVSFSEKRPKDATDMNAFRMLIHGNKFEHHKNWRLSSVLLKSFAVPTWIDSSPWLWAEPRDDTPEVIFARSTRYHNPEFNWTTFLTKYDTDAGFVGTEDEHTEFEKTVGKIQFIRTENLLEAARVIAGCQLFIGNQSSPLALAVGMGKACIVEEAMQTQNCCFNYQGFQYGGNCSAPTVKKRPVVEWRSLTDINSGIGKWSLETAKRLTKLKIRWTQTRRDETYESHPFSLNKLSANIKQRVVFDALPLVLKHIRDDDIAITIWESDELPVGAAERLNRTKCVIVPSAFCESVFRNSGVKVPIHRIDLGIDETLFNTPPRNRRRAPIKFGFATRCSLPSLQRKKADNVVSVFANAVGIHDNAVLELKGYDGVWDDVPKDKRFKTISQYYTDDEMRDWYNSLHYIINVATGGWELHAHEAMACGAVPIVINRGGVVEVTDAGNAFIVETKQEQARDGAHSLSGKWWIPDQASLQDAIRKAVHLEHKKWASKSMAARATALRYTWQRTAEWIEDLIIAYL